VLLSRAFADLVAGNFDLERVGEYPVRGFNDPIELFAYDGLAYAIAPLDGARRPLD
jgi:adenylate cyclase